MFVVEKGIAHIGEKRWETAGTMLKKTLRASPWGSVKSMLHGSQILGLLRMGSRARTKNCNWSHLPEFLESSLKKQASTHIGPKDKTGGYRILQASAFNPTLFEHEQSHQDTPYISAYTWLQR